MQRRELEICAETLESCLAAGEGGADRVELCAALREGGVTPTRAFVKAALGVSSIPIHILLRPRSGDFVYTDAEFRMMCEDLEDGFALGASGVVIGLLTPSRDIDCERTADLIRRADGFPVTFHRAFDHTRNVMESLEILIDLGCSRILTSGGEPDVAKGFAMLERLAQQADRRIRIAAGGGVTLMNASQLIEIQGLDLHASLIPKSSFAAGSDPLWSGVMERKIVSVDAVRQLGGLVHAVPTS